MRSKKAIPSKPLCHMIIWRVRLVSCDGRRLGKEWSAEFFVNKINAKARLMELITGSNQLNPKYPFKTEQEECERVQGYCNWHLGIMVTMDAVEVRPREQQAGKKYARKKR